MISRDKQHDVIAKRCMVTKKKEDSTPILKHPLSNVQHLRLKCWDKSFGQDHEFPVMDTKDWMQRCHLQGKIPSYICSMSSIPESTASTRAGTCKLVITLLLQLEVYNTVYHSAVMLLAAPPDTQVWFEHPHQMNHKCLWVFPSISSQLTPMP